MPIRPKQCGGALLTALFIMTLVAIVATAMSTRLQLDIYRTRLVIEQDKLYAASQGVTFWAFDQLLTQKSLPLIGKNGLIANYPKLNNNQYPPVQLHGEIYDLQARFNLNNLSERKWLNYFFNFLGQIYPQLTPLQRGHLISAITNWLSPYDLARGNDQYMTFYQSQRPPYYPAHHPFRNPSELRLVQGVDAKLYQQLTPLLTALPEPTPINILTCEKKLLRPLGNGLTNSQLNELNEERLKKPVPLKPLRELLKKLDIPAEQISWRSNYFLIVSHAQSNEYSINTYTIIKRSEDKKKRKQRFML